MSRFINTELKSDSDSKSSDSQSDSDLKSSNSDSDLKSSDSDLKLSNSDSESDSDLELDFSSSVNCNYILKCIFWGGNLNMHLCFEMYFLREQFRRTTIFWNVFFEGAILKNIYVLKLMNNSFKISGCWLVWLLLYIFMAPE